MPLSPRSNIPRPLLSSPSCTDDNPSDPLDRFQAELFRKGREGRGKQKVPLSLFVSVITRDSGLPGFPDFQDSNAHRAAWSVRQLAAALYLATARDSSPLSRMCILLDLLSSDCIGWMDSDIFSTQYSAGHVEASRNICLMNEF